MRNSPRSLEVSPGKLRGFRVPAAEFPVCFSSSEVGNYIFRHTEGEAGRIEM